MSSVKILATGSYLPSCVVTNHEFSEHMDTSDEWISSRTGIKSRHFALEERNAEMAAHSAKVAMENAGIEASDIACLVVATFSPDNSTPSVSSEVQKILGLPENMMAFDLNAACSGFVYGIQVVQGLLMQQPKKYALLIGSEKISNYMDFSDRNTCVLFGDGAGAAVIGLTDDGEYYSTMGSIGNTTAIQCEAAGTPGKIKMEGNTVFKFAVDAIYKSITNLLAESKMPLDEVDHIVCHQANKRIISHVYKKMRANPEKFFVNVDHIGNTSSASIPIALDEMNQKGLLKRGDKIICVGFGGGLTWGGILMTW